MTKLWTILWYLWASEEHHVTKIIDLENKCVLSASLSASATDLLITNGYGISRDPIQPGVLRVHGQFEDQLPTAWELAKFATNPHEGNLNFTDPVLKVKAIYMHNTQLWVLQGVGIPSWSRRVWQLMGCRSEQVDQWLWQLTIPKR